MSYWKKGEKVQVNIGTHKFLIEVENEWADPSHELAFAIAKALLEELTDRNSLEVSVTSPGTDKRVPG